MTHPAATSRLGEGDAEGGAPRGHGTAAAPHHHVNYLLVFYALIVLTGITVAVAFKRFEVELYNVGLAMLVASVKALLVARYFMHLKFEGRLIKLTLYFPLLLCVIMVAALIPDVVYGRKGDPIAEHNKPGKVFEVAK
jgi:cytochrome c oxidase subunit 4